MQSFIYAVIPALAGLFLSTPANKLMERLTDYAIEQIFEDAEVLRLREEIEKTKLKVELNDYKQQLAQQMQKLDMPKIEKRVSNHYEQLIKCEEVEFFEFCRVDEHQKCISEPKKLKRGEFESLILKDDELEDVVDDNATIEIVAPVIKASSMRKAKWSGIYNGQLIRFYMADKLYGRDIINRRVHFQHGSVIECSLVTKRKLTSEGDIREYEHRVYEVFETNTMIPQNLSKRRRRKKFSVAETSDLFDGLYEE